MTFDYTQEEIDRATSADWVKRIAQNRGKDSEQYRDALRISLESNRINLAMVAAAKGCAEAVNEAVAEMRKAVGA